MLLASLLERLIQEGSLTVVEAGGRRRTFGPGGEPAVVVRFHDPALPRRLALNPALALGEAYMDGDLSIESGSLRDFLRLCVSGGDALDQHPLERLRAPLQKVWRRIRQYTPVIRARRNVAHHYDLSGELFDLFLGADHQYSCAYFPEGDETLEEAQARKKRHLAAKLLLRPGQRVLDIGSGWGGMGLYLARAFGVDVKGITLSEEQWRTSQTRALNTGLAGRACFELKDYRQEAGEYDRVVSVGMFEHVGVNQYRTFFRRLRDLLKPDGVAVLHAIGTMGPPGGTNPWIDKYIFPGGYCPALSEVLAAIEKSGLWVTDIEILRLHYADTLREWERRFQANRERIRALYDERFCRMWEFYLTSCEMGFRYRRQMVFQIQLARRLDTVPRTRDYMLDFERAMGLDIPMPYTGMAAAKGGRMG